MTVEDRKPYSATIDGFPDAAVDSSEVELIGSSWNPTRRRDAPAAERPDHPPAESRKQLRRDWDAKNSVGEGFRIAVRRGSNQPTQIGWEYRERNSSAASASDEIAPGQKRI